MINWPCSSRNLWIMSREGRFWEIMNVRILIFSMQWTWEKIDDHPEICETWKVWFKFRLAASSMEPEKYVLRDCKIANYFLMCTFTTWQRRGISHSLSALPTLQQHRNVNMMNDSLMKLDLFMLCNTICYPPQ